MNNQDKLTEALINELKTNKIESDDTEYISKYDELDNLLDRFVSTEEQKLELYNALNTTEMKEFDEDIYYNWLDDMTHNNYVELRKYLDDLAETDDWQFNKITEGAKSNGPSVYVAIVELNYTLIAVGNSEDECKENLIKAFTKWASEHPDAGSVESWVENIANEDFAEYDFDTFRFLRDYYGIAIGRVDGFGVKEWL